MGPKPRLIVLNATCLDVLGQSAPWLRDINDVEIVTDASIVKTLAPENADRVIDGAAGLILPALWRSFPPAEFIERHPSLKVLAIAANGYDWLDIRAATRQGIVVVNAPVREGIEVVADMCFGLMLAVARQIPQHDRAMREGPYERGVGVSLWGKTLGIVGLGNIGKAVARRARGFDMKVLASTPRPDHTFAREHGIEVVSTDDLLRRSDFVSLHVRLNDSTANIFGVRELSLMKPSAFLINTARQELVDEAALTRAILDRKIAGCAMDDPPRDKQSPLLKLPNFVCSPHLGNRAVEGMVAVFRSAVEQAVTVLRGGRPPHVLNPEVYKTATQAAS
jgi:D-3-phosphoglycerate dehydrogenase